MAQLRREWSTVLQTANFASSKYFFNPLILIRFSKIKKEDFVHKRSGLPNFPGWKNPSYSTTQCPCFRYLYPEHQYTVEREFEFLLKHAFLILGVKYI